MKDCETYNGLARSSFREYQENLNWPVVAQRMIELMKTLD